jgi:uncharacterized protein (DUF433 family)
MGKNLDDYFDFLRDDDIRVKGHRIGIETILLEYLHRQRAPEQIQAMFPTLRLEDVYATILYYLANKEKVEAYLTDYIEYTRQARREQELHPHSGIVRLRKIKAERAAKEKQSVS